MMKAILCAIFLVTGCGKVLSSVCGDGVVNDGEQCDDGNDDDTDDCTSSCQLARCGDGFVQAGVEECDDGNDIDTDDCPSICQLARCGDGFVQAGVEECDDGNADDTDGCLTSCTPLCGDGFVVGLEECDDRNLTERDGCSSACKVEAGAACDDGSPSLCTAPCLTHPLWQRVGCAINSWVWTTDRTFQTLAAAEANRVLTTGCIHSGDNNNDGLCSLDGTGFVSTARFTMSGCDLTWAHIAPGGASFDCGGHDGDTVRRLVHDPNGCYNYELLPPP
jgi:cysteine-rich repeat protein